MTRTDVSASIEAKIAELLNEGVTADDVLKLTIARRLNRCSDSVFSEALGGAAGKPPLNFWGKR